MSIAHNRVAAMTPAANSIEESPHAPGSWCADATEDQPLPTFSQLQRILSIPHAAGAASLARTLCCRTNRASGVVDGAIVVTPFRPSRDFLTLNRRAYAAISDELPVLPQTSIHSFVYMQVETPHDSLTSCCAMPHDFVLLRGPVQSRSRPGACEPVQEGDGRSPESLANRCSSSSIQIA